MTSIWPAIAQRRMPGPDLAVIVAVMIAGAAAAELAASALWAVTPVVAATLVAASLRSAGRRPTRKTVADAPLPPRLERVVADTVATLPESAARNLLAEVVRHARTLFDSFVGQADGQRLSRDVGDLVEACCDIAREHARLDAVLPALWEPAFAPAAARGASDDMNGDELRRRGDASRELLTERLRDAASILEQMALQQGVERSGTAAQRVADLTSELAAEAAARRHAAHEIQRLLQGRG